MAFMTRQSTSGSVAITTSWLRFALASFTIFGCGGLAEDCLNGVCRDGEVVDSSADSAAENAGEAVDGADDEFLTTPGSEPLPTSMEQPDREVEMDITEISILLPPIDPNSADRIPDCDTLAQRNGPLLVTSQEQLLALSGCTTIAGGLTIHTFDGIDLSPLVDLRIVGEELRIQAPDASSREAFGVTAGGNSSEWLTSLAGLEKLAQVGTLTLTGLSLRDDSQFENLLVSERLIVTSNSGMLNMPSGIVLATDGAVKIEQNPELRSLDGLQLADVMGFVEINDNAKLLDISALEGVSRVLSVSLSNLPLLDNLLALRNVEAVTSLRIRSVPIANLGDLQGQPVVSWLSLDNVAIRSLAPVRTMQLDSLSLGAVPLLESLVGLEDYVSLREFSLGSSLVTSLEPLRNTMSNLQRVALRGTTALVDVQALGGAVALQWLDVTDNLGLIDLPTMPGVQSLAELILVGNSGLRSAPQFPNLTSVPEALFTVRDNPLLAELSGLAQLQQISQLEVVGNDSLRSIDMRSLNSADFIDISCNASLPQVQVQAVQSLVPNTLANLVGNFGSGNVCDR